MWVVSITDTNDDSVDDVFVPIDERLVVETLTVVIMNFNSDSTKEYDEVVSTLYGKGFYRYAPKKLYLDLKHRTTTPTRPSIEDPLVLEFKALPSHLCYIFFIPENT